MFGELYLASPNTSTKSWRRSAASGKLAPVLRQVGKNGITYPNRPPPAAIAIGSQRWSQPAPAPSQARLRWRTRSRSGLRTRRGRPAPHAAPTPTGPKLFAAAPTVRIRTALRDEPHRLEEYSEPGYAQPEISAEAPTDGAGHGGSYAWPLLDFVEAINGRAAAVRHLQGARQ